MSVLGAAVKELKQRKDVQGWCLKFTREAIEKVSQSHALPRRNTALHCFETFSKNPTKYGFRQVHSPLDQYPYVLVFFSKCGGQAQDGSTCGHVGIYSTGDGTIYSSKDYQWNQYWANRIVGAYVEA